MALRLLVVDDEEDFLDILGEWLVYKGYNVSTATNGREALDKLGEGKFDLVLLDLMMPVMDGYEFCKMVREGKVQSDIPIVVLSAIEKYTGLDKAKSVGADAYLEKMTTHEEIEQTIDRVLEERSASGSSLH